MAGRGASRLRHGALRHVGGGGGVGDSAAAPCLALLLPGLGWLGPEVVGDVLEGWARAVTVVPGPGVGLGFGSGLRQWCVNGFERAAGAGFAGA